jgi:hypothetical protein
MTGLIFVFRLQYNKLILNFSPLCLLFHLSTVVETLCKEIYN